MGRVDLSTSPSMLHIHITATGTLQRALASSAAHSDPRVFLPILARSCVLSPRQLKVGISCFQLCLSVTPLCLSLLWCFCLHQPCPHGKPAGDSWGVAQLLTPAVTPRPLQASQPCVAAPGGFREGGHIHAHVPFCKTGEHSQNCLWKLR